MIGKIANVSLIAFIAWIAISYIDVVAHNLGNYICPAWNFFEILCKTFL